MAQKRGRKPAARKRGGRKKSTREVKPQQELPGGFWNQVWAVVMIVMAIVLVLTWFGSGGSLLEQISGGLYYLVGYAEYLVPIALVYLAVKIFLSESNQIPTAMWVMTILVIFWVAGMTGLPAMGSEDLTGGVIGNWLNGIMTQILDPGVAALIYIVLIFLTGVFILETSPAAVFRAVAQMFRGTEKVEDGKNARVARRAERGGGKEVEVHMGDEDTGGADAVAKKTPIRLNSPAVAPKVAAPSPSPEKALVSVTDPNWKFPLVDILEKKMSPPDAGNHQQNALIIKSTLQDFGID